MRAVLAMGVRRPIRNPERKIVVLVLACACLLPPDAWAHAKGLYKTRAEAEQRARELGCKAAHQNKGLWMPCSHEGMLHKELREE